MHTNKMTQHQCLLQVSCLTNNIKIACHLQAKWNANCDSFLHLQKFPRTSGKWTSILGNTFSLFIAIFLNKIHNQFGN